MARQDFWGDIRRTMKWDTYRVNGMVFHSAIDKSLMKHSQELLVLAILRYLYPEEYSEVTFGERPDLQSAMVGVEVTIAESQEIMKINREFAQYCEEDNYECRRKTILKSGKYSINTLAFNEKKRIESLTFGGGINYGEKESITNAIRRKIDCVKKYPSNQYKRKMELAILRVEIPSSIWMESVTDWIKACIDINESVFQRIYAIGRNTCFCYDVEKNTTTINNIDKNVFEKLKIIARMTAEGTISIDDEEWT